MRFRDTIKFTHVALGLIPEVLNTVDVVVAVCKQLGMVDSEVVEVRHIQRVIAPPAIRVDD